MAKKTTKRKPLTPNQREWQKQAKRINKYVKQIQEEGGIFLKDIVPPMPSKVTKSAIESLRKITPTDIRKRASLVDEDTGEIIGSVYQHEQDKKRMAREYKVAQTSGNKIIVSTILAQFITRLQSETPDSFIDWKGKSRRRASTSQASTTLRKNQLLTLVEEQRQAGKEDELAVRLQNAGDDIWANLDVVMYGYGDMITNSYLSLAEIIKGETLSASELQGLEELGYENEMGEQYD